MVQGGLIGCPEPFSVLIYLIIISVKRLPETQMALFGSSLHTARLLQLPSASFLGQTGNKSPTYLLVDLIVTSLSKAQDLPFFISS